MNAPVVEAIRPTRTGQTPPLQHYAPYPPHDVALCGEPRGDRPLSARPLAERDRCIVCVELARGRGLSWGEVP